MECLTSLGWSFSLTELWEYWGNCVSLRLLGFWTWMVLSGPKDYLFLLESVKLDPILFCFLNSMISLSIFWDICLNWSDNSCLFLLILPSYSLLLLLVANFSFIPKDLLSFSTDDRLDLLMLKSKVLSSMPLRLVIADDFYIGLVVIDWLCS